MKREQTKQYFGTDGIRGVIGEDPMLPEVILKLGWSIGQIIKFTPKYNKVLIGKDPRISSDMLESALCAGLLSAGVNVNLLGVLPTPAVAFLANKLKANFGIMISASHNTYCDNGIKLFDNNGEKLSNKLQIAIEENMQKKLTLNKIKNLGKVSTEQNTQEKYIDFCKKSFPNNLTLNGLKIIVDCANGANYEIATKVFGALGAKHQAIAASPDGININLNCGSTNPKFLIKTVKEYNADIGIAFDGDSDRVVLVDNKGQVFDGDDLLFIIANSYIASGKKLPGVIGTIMSNFGLERAFDSMGLSFIRTKVGDRYICEELIKRRWDLGGEASGHIICRNINSTGDGIVAALKVLEAMVTSGKSLAELIKPMEKYPQVLINVPIKKSSNTKIILNNNVFKKAYKLLERQLCGQGRVVVRPSGTEPVMRVMVEGVDKKLINMLAKELEQAIVGVI